MSPSLFFFFSFILGFSSICFPSSVGSEFKGTNLARDPHHCPLNFSNILKMFPEGSYNLVFRDVSTECHYILQRFRLFRSEYLRTTGYFSFPPNSSEACWSSFQAIVNEKLGGFDVRSSCSVHTNWISNNCMNIATGSEFQVLIPEPALKKVKDSCNDSLGDISMCSSCISSLSSIQEIYNHSQKERDPDVDCVGYTHIYAAAFVNQFGPTNLGTAKCLFSVDFSQAKIQTKRHENLLRTISIGCGIGFGSVFLLSIWFIYWYEHWRKKAIEVKKFMTNSGPPLLSGSITLLKFSYGEMREATKSFARENLVGCGRYGNVYRGVLANGSEVALKRFKNSSVYGEVNFAHEVEVIASVKHVNLVPLRGYCTEKDPFGHNQRIIVCDLMRNGSLYDHLFVWGAKAKLAWPVRKKIALGTAKGLAYLHYSVLPSIIHRDVKTSNILLDDTFEPKLADFGLAKFNPDGLSHLSTRVTGTLGYIAPEYALYGKLTEKCDVYSFGVVFLELLSGRKAILSVENGQALLLTDWAWSLVRKGQILDIIEEGMEELGDAKVMERYVLLAVLCAHPQLNVRPTMEQIVKILETENQTDFVALHHSVSLQHDVIDIESMTVLARI